MMMMIEKHDDDDHCNGDVGTDDDDKHANK